MRFGTPDRPPLASNWRLILWAVTLLPALLILSWSVRQARQPQADPVFAGRTPEEVQRLKRLLSAPHDSPAIPLRNDEVRVLSELIVSQDRFDRSLLSAVNDNTFGITAAEKDAYDALLAQVGKTPLADLEQIARADVPFAVLMLEAERFRGELLTLEGVVRRCRTIASPPEEPPSHEAWLFTADSGVNPYRVVFTELPTGMSLGDELKPPIRVRVTGYFFKRYSYATAEDFHTAPLLLANTLTVLAPVTPRSPQPTARSRSLTYLAVGILAAFLSVGLLVEFVAWRRSRRRELRSPDADDTPDFSWLDRP